MSPSAPKLSIAWTNAVLQELVLQFELEQPPTPEQLGDLERLVASFVAVGGHADDAGFATPADCWGDLGAASGPLFAILAAFAAAKGYALGPCSFLWASSESGQRAAALLKATNSRRS